MGTSPTQNGHFNSRWIVRTQREVGQFFGVGRRTISDWLRRGAPDVRDDDDRRTGYCLSQIARWYREAIGTPDATTDDTLMAADGDSPALERWRVAKAELAELELAQRQNDLIDRRLTRESLSRVAAILRAASETLQREFGPEAHAVIDEALDDCERMLDEFFGANDDGMHQPT